MTPADIYKQPYQKDDAELVAERSRLLTELGHEPPWWRPFRRRRWAARRSEIWAMDVSAQWAAVRRILRAAYPVATVEQMVRFPLYLGAIRRIR